MSASVIARLMVRTSALSLLALALVSFQAISEEITTNSLADGKMSVRGYHVPPEFFVRTDVQDKSGKRKLVAGVHPIPGSNGDLDVSEFLKQSGLTFPNGSMAVYNQNYKILSVVNTRENLDLADSFIQVNETDEGCAPCLVNSDLTAVEFTAPSSDQVFTKSIVPYSDFVKIAGKTPRVVAHVSVLGESGYKSTVQQILKASHERKGDTATRPPSAPSEAFLGGESGSKVELEPTVGPEMTTIDCNLACRFRFDFQGRDVLIEFVTVCRTWDGCPVVVHVSPIPGKEGRYLAIVLRLQATNAGGWRQIDELQKLRGAEAKAAGK